MERTMSETATEQTDLLVNGRPIRYDTVPAPHMRGAVERYMEHGIPPGGFLTALLANDLIRAAGAADDINGQLLKEWASWLYNCAPPASFGSREAVASWMQQRQNGAA
jgi:hypothetical protein